MARTSVLNNIIRESISKVASKSNKDGFGYEDVELRVWDRLPDQLREETRTSLASQRMRDKIRAEAKKISMEDILAPSLQLDLLDDALMKIYPVKHPGETTRFKHVAHLNKRDINHIISTMIGDRKGLNKHITAFRKIERRLKRAWLENPDLTIEEAQGYLRDQAA